MYAVIGGFRYQRAIFVGKLRDLIQIEKYYTLIFGNIFQDLIFLIYPGIRNVIYILLLLELVAIVNIASLEKWQNDPVNASNFFNYIFVLIFHFVL